MQTVKRQVLEEARGRKVVQASLNYIAQTSEKPVYYAYDPLPETARQRGCLFPQTVPLVANRDRNSKVALV
jgi:hypothetical protein